MIDSPGSDNANTDNQEWRKQIMDFMKKKLLKYQDEIKKIESQ